MASEKAKMKKLYVKALMAQGDKRSYNEIQADLELHLWHQRFNAVFDVDKADAVVEPKVEE